MDTTNELVLIVFIVTIIVLLMKNRSLGILMKDIEKKQKKLETTVYEKENMTKKKINNLNELEGKIKENLKKLKKEVEKSDDNFKETLEKRNLGYLYERYRDM